MGRIVHFELPVDDPERAARFYRDALGWEIQKWDGPIPYWMIMTGDDGEPGIDGALTLREGGIDQTVNTVDVDDLDAAVARVEQHGGRVVMPRTAVPGVGYMAYCADTEGNRFGLMQMDESAGQE
jgi:hypothetical protein